MRKSIKFIINNKLITVIYSKYNDYEVGPSEEEENKYSSHNYSSHPKTTNMRS